jgi:hypothetical protein
MRSLEEIRETIEGPPQICLSLPWGQKLLVTEAGVDLGRDAKDCEPFKRQIKVRYPQVSGLHLRISIDSAGDVFAVDLHSMNGTYVNGELLVPGKLTQLYLTDHLTLARDVPVLLLPWENDG